MGSQSSVAPPPQRGQKVRTERPTVTTMKVAFILAACLLAYVAAQNSLYERTLLGCICNNIEGIIPATTNILGGQIETLCYQLNQTITPNEPSFERVQHFKTWILMKFDMIEGLVRKGKTIKDRFPDLCELSQFLKFYLCCLTDWIYDLRCEIRQLDCYLVFHYNLQFIEQIRIILNTLDKLDVALLDITKCYQIFYINLHCDSTVPWDGRKSGKATGPPVMMNKDMADTVIMEETFNILDEDINMLALTGIEVSQDAIDARLATSDTSISSDTNVAESMSEAGDAMNALKIEAREILTAEERSDGEMCSYTKEYRDFLCDLVIRKQLLRNKIRKLEIFLKLIIGPSYKYSNFKSYIDKLHHLFYKLDYFILRIGLHYIDFFIKVHCDNSDCWCMIRGDPIVKTCDDKHLYLSGAGWYTLAIIPQGAPCNRLMVFVKVEMVQGRPLPVKMVIYMLANGNWIKIEICEDHTVFVDGVQILSFPNIISQDLNLLGAGTDFTMVQTDCGYIGFWYEYPTSRGKVHLDNILFNHVKGLCGDYDGIRADDMKLANGTASGDYGAISDSFRMDDLPPIPNP